MTGPFGAATTPLPSVHTPPPEVPGAQLPDQTQLLSWGAKFIEGIVRRVVLAIIGVVFPGSAEGQLSAFFDGLNLPGMATNVTGMLTGVVTGTVSTIGGLLGGFLNALLGFGSSVIPAYTPANAAVAGVQGQINALAGAALPGGAGMFDGFNSGTALSSKWAHICGTGDIVTPDGIAFSPTNFECHRYDDDRPGTTFWQVQGSVAFVDGTGFGGGRVFGGADSTLGTRFPAIEYIPDVAGQLIRLVSLEGTPSTPGDRDLGRIVHDAASFGFFVIKTGDVLALECDEATGIYNVYLNPGPGTAPICTYDDSVANLIPRGVGHRDGGLQFNLGNTSGFPGNAWDNFSLFDRAV